MTQEEVYNIIATEIIDNTTRLIDPAKLRGVLNAIVALVPVSSDPSSLTATTPLSIDEFTSNISISQADESTPGYISALDFKKFDMGTNPVPATDFRPFCRGYKDGVINTGDPKANDIYVSFRPTSDLEGAGDFGFFQYIDEEKTDQDPTAFIPVMVSAVNIT